MLDDVGRWNSNSYFIFPCWISVLEDLNGQISNCNGANPSQRLADSHPFGSRRTTAHWSTALGSFVRPPVRMISATSGWEFVTVVTQGKVVVASMLVMSSLSPLASIWSISSTLFLIHGVFFISGPSVALGWGIWHGSWLMAHQLYNLGDLYQNLSHRAQ